MKTLNLSQSTKIEKAKDSKIVGKRGRKPKDPTDQTKSNKTK